MAGTLIKSGLRAAFFDSLITQIKTRGSRFYFCLGQPSPWPEEGLPPDPSDSAEFERFTRRNIVISKIVDPINSAVVAKRIDWQLGKVFDQYDDVDTPSFDGGTGLRESEFYVITTEGNVYICLCNANYSPSTVPPSGTDARPFTTPDGYTWKFMFQVSPAQRTKFLTPKYIPVFNPILSDFYKKGSINNISIRSPGKNFISKPSVAVIGDGFLEDNPFDVTGISLSQPGSGYTVAPNITIAEPIDIYYNYQAGLQVFLGQHVKYLNKYYQVVRAGLLGDIPPQHESGVVEGQMANNASLKYVATRANAVASITNGSVSSVKLLGFIDRVEVVSKGSGYILQNTTVTATGSGSGAVLIPEIVNGKIEAIYVSSKGSGYDANTTQIVITSTTPVTAASATAIVKFSYGYRTPPSVLIESSPTGFNAEVSLQASKTDAIIEADIDIATGAISKVKIVDGGVGYTFAKLLVSGGGGSQALLEPIVDFGDLTSSQADIQLLAQPGSISGFKVTSAGVNYTTANVEIVGDGTGATAEAHIDENGGIDYIFIKTQGLNYSYAEAIITGDGIGATARVIFAPPLGHGFNPQQELLPRGVGLYAGFSNEANQGIFVDNDYRQISILKDPFQYGKRVFASDTVLYPTFVSQLQGTAPLIADDMLQKQGTQSFFKIVEIENNTVLLISQGKDVLLDGDFLSITKNGITYTLEATSVITPNFDKNSGELIYIDNIRAFKYSSQQFISVRSIIEFE